MNPSDAALVRACQQGSTEAWNTLVLRYQRLIYTVPRRAGLNEEESADVFQRVFLKLVEQIQRIEQPDRIRSWLVTTARRETLAILRRSQYQQSKPTDEDQGRDPLDTIEADTPLPGELLEQLEEQHLVRQALTELDSRCQTLLAALFSSHDPQPYAAIASNLGIPEGSIGPTRARCLQRLRKALDSLGFFSSSER